MRKLVFCLAAFAGALFSFARADAATIIRLHAASVNFYYDRFLVEADGNVHVTTSDGMTMTGDSFSMDLKLNRFVLAGHVHMSDPSGSQSGAALADFLDFNRIYFVPIIEMPRKQATDEPDPLPDRWTFLGGDFAHPVKGRTMPGDTFFFPDLGDDKPYIKTDSAVIGAKSFVRFAGNSLDLANGLGAYVPTPSYYVNFSNDRHLNENSLAGATFDATWQVAGGANAITALHFRYDPVNKTYLAFEQHISGKKAYAVFSLNPITRPSKFWNLILSDQPSDKFQVKTFTQLHTFQYGLRSPDESGQFTNIQATQALPHSYLQLNSQFVNYTMLPYTVFGYEGHGVVLFHPFNIGISGQTFTHRVGKLPLFESIQYGMGYDYNSYGLQTIRGVTYDQVWHHNVGFQAFIPSVKIGDQYNKFKYYAFNATLVKNRQWNSSGHYTDFTDTRGSLSRQFSNHLASFLNYEVTNVGDYYGADQSFVYPSYVPVVGGVAYPSYAAFQGIATFRTLSLGFNYVNNGSFSASLLARKHDDFPKPIPGFFVTPPLNVIGQQQSAYFLGQPPYDITGEVRVRIDPHMTIDLSRTYYFNFGNQRWSPQFVIQVQQ